MPNTPILKKKYFVGDLAWTFERLTWNRIVDTFDGESISWEDKKIPFYYVGLQAWDNDGHQYRIASGGIGIIWHKEVERRQKYLANYGRLITLPPEPKTYIDKKGIHIGPLIIKPTGQCY